LKCAELAFAENLGYLAEGGGDGGGFGFGVGPSGEGFEEVIVVLEGF
jgi:hypothetical protein